MQLLESGRRNLQIRKLGLDMLRQLSLNHDYVLLLVQDGYYLEALRYARKTKVNTLFAQIILHELPISNCHLAWSCAHERRTFLFAHLFQFEK